MSTLPLIPFLMKPNHNFLRSIRPVKEPRRVQTAHESHNQYITNDPIPPSPMLLSHRKYEADRRMHEANMLHQQQRQAEFQRQYQAARQQQQAAVAAAAALPVRPRSFSSLLFLFILFPENASVSQILGLFVFICGC